MSSFHDIEAASGHHDAKKTIAASKAKNDALYYLEGDSRGLFARFAHVTSSANIEHIRRDGLSALNNPREAVHNYLRNLPNRPSDNEILNVMKNKTRLGSLLYNRFDHNVGELFMLPLIGSEIYINSAADNAARDGGEIFCAARKEMEIYLNRKFVQLYPDATSIIVVAKLYFLRNGDMITLPNIPFFDPININNIKKEMICGNVEIRVNKKIIPDDLIYMSRDKFFNYRREIISEETLGNINDIFNRNNITAKSM